MASTDIILPTGESLAAHSFTEDSETRYVERAAPGTGVLDLPGTAQIEAQSAANLYPADAIDIQGKARVVIKTNFSVASALVTFQILLYDSAGDFMGVLPSPSEVYSAIASAAEADGGRYIGTMFLFSNESGTASLKIRLTGAVTSGNISIFVAGV